MKKHPATRSKASDESGFIQQRVLPVLEVIVALKDGLRDLVVTSGMQVLEALLEQDREKLCGPKRKQQSDREAYRYGYDQGQLVMGGRKVAVSKPRVRRVGAGEVVLPTSDAFRRTDPLEERVISAVRREHAQVRTQPRPAGSGSQAHRREAIERVAAVRRGDVREGGAF